MSSITISVPPYRISNHSGGRCGYHHSLEYLIYYLIQYGLNYISLVAFIGDYGIGFLRNMHWRVILMELKIFRAMISYVQSQYLVLGYQSNLFLTLKTNVISCQKIQQDT